MGLFGGSKSTTVQGYGALPAWAQNTLYNINNGISGINAGQFTPISATPDELQAFQNIRQGFTPTADSISSDIAMQQNPYNEYVINEINRQAQGQNSILQQNLNNAGQFGSNRQVLGANDIDLSRQNQIGGFLQSQYNQSLNNALTTLPALRAADTQGLLDIGNFDRNLALQTAQAPVQALQTQAGIASGLGYGVDGSTTTTKSGGGLFQGIGQIGSLASGASALGGLSLGKGATLATSLAGLFSDERLKENVEEYGEENGHKVYKYNYKGSDKKFIGVMAQDVIKTNPDAVTLIDGYYAVDYNMIGVNFREADPEYVTVDLKDL